MTLFASRPVFVARMRVRLVIRRLRVRPPPDRQYSFVDIEYEIFSTAILFLPLVQAGSRRTVVSFLRKNVHNTD